VSERELCFPVTGRSPEEGRSLLQRTTTGLCFAQRGSADGPPGEPARDTGLVGRRLDQAADALELRIGEALLPALERLAGDTGPR
jgi:hypothetical protein